MNIRNEQINITPVKDRLPAIAFELFRKWTKDVGIADTLVIKNEQKLVQDLEKSLKGALQSLLEEDISFKPVGWEIGFFYGSIENSLAALWSYQYKVKMGEHFKAFAGLKAIDLYFKVDKQALTRVNDLYETLLEEDCNIQYPDARTSTHNIRNEKLVENMPTSRSKIERLLDRLVYEQVCETKLVQENVHIDVTPCFTQELTKELIRLNNPFSGN